jgi:SAM-dependent methyltransferase
MSGTAGSNFIAGRGIKAGLRRFAVALALTPIQRYIIGPAKLRRNSGKTRFLEIGPGAKRISGFETFNVVGGPQVDYVGSATKRLPFPDGTFDVVYASHIREHTAWYRSAQTLSEWVRVLKPGGVLEGWVPDGLKIAEAFVAAERHGLRDYEQEMGPAQPGTSTGMSGCFPSDILQILCARQD